MPQEMHQASVTLLNFSMFMRVKILEPLQSRCQLHVNKCQYQTFPKKKKIKCITTSNMSKLPCNNVFKDTYDYYSFFNPSPLIR